MSFKFLIASRGHCRQQITKRCNAIRDGYSNFGEIVRNEHIASLNSLKVKVEDFNLKIAELVFNEKGEEALAEEFEISEEYNILISTALASLTVSNTDVPRAHSDMKYSLKMPEIPLPEYSHLKGESIERFFRDFEDITAKMNLDSYSKLVLLQKQLHNEALTLVQSLNIDDRKYESGKALLLEAFGSSDDMKNDAMMMLTGLHMKYDSDPYKFIGDMRMIVDSFKNLKMSTDDVLQYFFLKAMNDKFRDHLTEVTKKTNPTVEEIHDNIFEVTKRYIESQKRFHTRKQSDTSRETNASDVIKKSPLTPQEKLNLKQCVLCATNNVPGNHAIFACEKFPTAKAKINRLKSLKRCHKCTGSHEVSRCNFKFNYNCKYCPDLHFSFLCISEETIPKSQGSGGNHDTNNGMSHEVNKQSNVVLPTFTVNLPNGNTIRCLKDGGSQLSFVTDEIADSNNCITLENNFNITVNGFNGSKTYSTRIVKFEFSLGKAPKVVNAVCIPRIRTSFSLPGLAPIVDTFLTRGYTLADEFLVAKNFTFNKFDFLLGADYDYYLPTTSHLINPTMPATYLSSPIGVLFVGSLDRLNNGLPFLPDSSSTIISEVASTLNDLCSVSDDLGETESDYGETIGNSFAVDLCGIQGCGERGLNADEVLEGTMKDDHDTLLSSCKYVLDDDVEIVDDKDQENEDIVDFVLNSTSRSKDGRLIMPLLWKGNVSHLLAKNENLAMAILKSIRTKYNHQPELLHMIDQTFKDQLEEGVIEEISDLDSFKESYPFYSFLPHMPVFRMDRETTKCRVVYLSNLKDKCPDNRMVVSHNQAMLAGPCMNSKISTAILQLRFDSYLLCFDIKKAFLSIGLNEFDKVRLLLYWFRNVTKGDYKLVAYKHNRLPFGLKSSPALLMLGLYKILIVDVENDSPELQNLKKLIYSLSYMDNLAVTANSTEDIKWAYDNLLSIFSPYQICLQQFLTNSPLQEELDVMLETSTDNKVKLLGLTWERDCDTLATIKLNLNQEATTKRQILSSIASNFDVFNFNAPLLNRARLFFQRLQYMNEFDWDTHLTNNLQREWTNITNQVNSAPELKVPRCMGKRSDAYRLIAFTDASKQIYATVVYIQSLDTDQVSFVLSKNKLLNKNLAIKSIPCLEFLAVALGVEVLHELRRELSGPGALVPIDVASMELYTDSSICLNWINLYFNKMDKMKNVSVMVKNKLHMISRLCEDFPITFSFCEGHENPADLASRPVSYYLLNKSNFFSGPQMLNSNVASVDALRITVPNPLISATVNNVDVCEETNALQNPLIKVDKFSSFGKLVRVYKYVLQFINNCKKKLMETNPHQYQHFQCLDDVSLHREAVLFVIRFDQYMEFKDIFQYFSTSCKTLKDIPDLVAKYNIFIDEKGIMRVKSKCFRKNITTREQLNPILLSKNSLLTKAIILDIHHSTKHAGFYTLLSEIRKQYFIIHAFSTIKRVLRSCVICKRLNGRHIKLNQSAYKDDRLMPSNVPFRFIYLDYMGPFFILDNKQKMKVWILVVTCMWSRAVNLKVCHDLTTATFLRALQLHVFDHGLPDKIFSDLGSQIVSGLNTVKSFLSDSDTFNYLSTNGISCLQFEQYFKGHSQLGSLVESCVKIVKKLIYGSIKKNVLSLLDFEFVISEVNHIANRRPIAFKEGLRKSDLQFPAPITPEMLVKGYELASVNIIPDFQSIPDDEFSWDHEHITDAYSNLRKVRERLRDIYNGEFMAQMIQQATDKKSRYIPKKHHKLNKGDIVLIKDHLQKPTNYDMARVLDVRENELEEVTGAVLLKGNGSKVHYHVESLIPLLTINEQENFDIVAGEAEEENLKQSEPKFLRQAAKIAKEKIKHTYLVGDS